MNLKSEDLLTFETGGSTFLAPKLAFFFLSYPPFFLCALQYSKYKIYNTQSCQKWVGLMGRPISPQFLGGSGQKTSPKIHLDFFAPYKNEAGLRAGPLLLFNLIFVKKLSTILKFINKKYLNK